MRQRFFPSFFLAFFHAFLHAFLYAFFHALFLADFETDFPAFFHGIFIDILFPARNLGAHVALVFHIFVIFRRKRLPVEPPHDFGKNLIMLELGKIRRSVRRVFRLFGKPKPAVIRCSLRVVNDIALKREDQPVFRQKIEMLLLVLCQEQQAFPLLKQRLEFRLLPELVFPQKFQHKFRRHDVGDVIFVKAKRIVHHPDQRDHRLKVAIILRRFQAFQPGERHCLFRQDFKLQAGVQRVIQIKALHDVRLEPLLHVNDHIRVLDLAAEIELHVDRVIRQQPLLRQHL